MAAPETAVTDPAEVSKHLWDGVRKEAEARFDRTTRLQITGYDVDPKVLDTARCHLRQPDLVERGAHFRPQPVNAFRTTKQYGVVITNPPYGERLGEAPRPRTCTERWARCCSRIRHGRCTS